MYVLVTINVHWPKILNKRFKVQFKHLFYLSSCRTCLNTADVMIQSSHFQFHSSDILLGQFIETSATRHGERSVKPRVHLCAMADTYAYPCAYA